MTSAPPLRRLLTLLLASAAVCSDHRLARIRRHQVTTGWPASGPHQVATGWPASGPHQVTTGWPASGPHQVDARRPDDDSPTTSACTAVATIDAPANHFYVSHCPTNRAYLVRMAHAANPSFLVRIVGPHTLYSGLSRSINATTHSVSYSLRHAGRHHAFIRVLLEDTPRNNVTGACLSRLPVVTHEFDVGEEDVVRATQVEIDDSCCWQTVNNLTARWTEFADVSSEQATIRHKYNDFLLNASHLLPDATLSPCLTNASICLYGDSQTRNLRDSLQAFLNGTPSINATIAYTLLRYPSNLTDALHASASTPCTHRLFNYGHWPLGWVEYRPWTMQELKTELAAFLSRIQALPGHIFWLSTPPFPQTHPRVAACPPQDWRLLTHIDAYNEVAKALLHHHPTIHYIDTFRPMLHLHDFTFDGSHYQEPVAPGVARVVLSRLCQGMR